MAFTSVRKEEEGKERVEKREDVEEKVQRKNVEEKEDVQRKNVEEDVVNYYIISYEIIIYIKDHKPS